MVCVRDMQAVSFLVALAFPLPAWAEDGTDAIKELQREVKEMRSQMQGEINHLKQDLAREHALREREHASLIAMEKRLDNRTTPLRPTVPTKKQHVEKPMMARTRTVSPTSSAPIVVAQKRTEAHHEPSHDEVAQTQLVSSEQPSPSPAAPKNTSLMPVWTRPSRSDQWVEGRNTPPDHGLDLSLSDFKHATEEAEVMEVGGMRIGFPSGRPTLSSKDGRYAFSVGLVAHIDIGGFPSSDGQRYGGAGRFAKLNENARRLRLPLSWRYNNFIVSLTPEWGRTVDGTAGLYEANMTYTGFKNSKLVLGYYQPRVTLYDSESSNDFQLMERPAISEVVRLISAGDARMTVGGKTHGKDWFASAYLTGQTYGDRTADPTISDSQVGSVLRVAGRPVHSKDWDLHLGASATMSFKRNQNAQGRVLALIDRPETRLTNERLVGTGTLLGVKNAWAVGPEIALRYRSLLVQAEYYHVGVTREQQQRQQPAPNLGFDGYYVSAGYTLIGRPRRYRDSSAAFTAPQAMDEFDPTKGHWGALEVVGRWSVMDFNSGLERGVSPSLTGGVQGGKQNVLSGGLNWYLNRHYRVQVQYSHIHATPSRTVGTTNNQGRTINMIGSRFQAAF
ncbi:OprO/OprP family phosphate-selective porin [Saccharibacter floricola]|uniref:Polyphosphate-selective porin O n=1 Tax=Saccharibacter floricola DSM 15669 TaxID=1123227 RepID=A0ABQ0NX41_9PROT|nr:porin [Saccharibacter floricola]GBQ05207.1 polyphosphate-selective porin O [Saccharibacter floricola DSM 15669]